ncbi:TraR/DksA C4-type zinc finger protein [Paenibacillus glycanilyticus]|uniref:TraR/DksA C4-type zinc finger protein n=1 Tax=Paenibacillus glycanilyticus TaxID=126569 RepID=UPI00203AD68D|nr:TraR/DksA C4-type zinc finger protein [Paenibacillus glycanilyticus]MCM3626426.1 TraR/DksA C4-type zinc finger protein [Paenibacillus glycanilyticus]
MPNATQLAHLRSRLEAEKREIEERQSHNEHNGLASSLRDNTGELSPIDNHPADLGTEMFERSKDLALLEKEDLHLARISMALEAMDKGTYGQCLVCGQQISDERLEALPDSMYCLEHSPRQEISHNRPVEEEFLAHPFGRSSRDDDDYNGFDGEDAWQIVEQWGTSESPAYSENNNAEDYDHIGIEADENDGFVESYESFVATDITGNHVSVIRNRNYKQYMDHNEGDHDLELE